LNILYYRKSCDLPTLPDVVFCTTRVNKEHLHWRIICY